MHQESGNKIQEESQDQNEITENSRKENLPSEEEQFFEIPGKEIQHFISQTKNQDFFSPKELEENLRKNLHLDDTNIPQEDQKNFQQRTQRKETCKDCNRRYSQVL
ncbi:hypothetical protein BB560_002929 [Smittium megazygosporum]|uniref:Uncharacterized protein n=1 Tax=Smittium megazygosporum TaxID=133381 RepID=A0A2T9ZDD6_9FUNG|nr:hypothetical protein BB560_002929 [Smittium megazygosporum]